MEDAPPAKVEINFPRPLDLFGGDPVCTLVLLGHEEFGRRLASELAKAEARLAEKYGRSDIRADCDRVVCLRNLVEHRPRDDARDAREVAGLAVRAYFARGGTVGRLEEARRHQGRQVVLRLAEIDRERDGEDLAGFRVPGLEAKMVAGRVDLIEGVRRLGELWRENEANFSALSRFKDAVEARRPALSEKCRELVARFGRDQLVVANREALLKRGLFRRPDGHLDRLQARVDAATAEFERMRSPSGVEPGPLEQDALAKLTAAIEARDDHRRELDASALRAAEHPVDRAAEGDFAELLHSARQVPHAFPASFVGAFEAVELEVALSVDVEGLALLIA